MVELRKRKTPPPAPEKAAKRKPGPKSKVTKAKEAAVDAVDAAATAVSETVTKVEESVTNGANTTASSGKPEVGSKLELDGFGGDVETHDGQKTTLKKLVDASDKGVVLFTYPKASTPGCTKQACLFRDSYAALSTTSGFGVFGLSTDSPKANTAFKTKQNLPYTLLCDPSASLIRAIGLAKAPKGTVRGVFVVDKSGKVLAAEPGGPDATVEVVRKIVAGGSGGGEAGDGSSNNKGSNNKKKSGGAKGAAAGAAKGEDKEKADTAGEVADAAEAAGVDGGKK